MGRGRRPRPGGASLRTTPLRPCPPAPPTPLGAASRSRPPPPHTPPLPAQPLAVRTRARPARGRARARTARGAWLQCRRPRPAPGCSCSSRGAAAGKLSHARHANPFCAHPFAPGWASAPMPPPRGRLQGTTHCWGLPPPGSLKAPPSLSDMLDRPGNSGSTAPAASTEANWATIRVEGGPCSRPCSVGGDQHNLGWRFLTTPVATVLN